MTLGLSISWVGDCELMKCVVIIPAASTAASLSAQFWPCTCRLCAMGGRAGLMFWSLVRPHNDYSACIRPHMTRTVPARRTALNVDQETEVTSRCKDSSMHTSLGDVLKRSSTSGGRKVHPQRKSRLRLCAALLKMLRFNMQLKSWWSQHSLTRQSKIKEVKREKTKHKPMR